MHQVARGTLIHYLSWPSGMELCGVYSAEARACITDAR